MTPPSEEGPPTLRGINKKRQSQLLRLISKAIGADPKLAAPWVMGTIQFRKASRFLGQYLIEAGWKPPE